ncbi:MAG: helix-turn-helix domain-containing protein [Parasphingopyxis sp.]|uniref:helix-turn-helix domain-containing protein n=1 Tax=Parasphingopyxis sp. TaxID=1920299 RepID=UPI003F9FF1E8
MGKSSSGKTESASPSKADIYYIEKADEVAALISAKRQPIIDLLAAQGPLAAREIAAGLGMKTSAIYHHLHKLAEVGLVRETGARTTSRRSEKLYDTPAVAMRLGISLDDGEQVETWRKLHLAQSRQTDRDFLDALESGGGTGEGSERNLRTYRVVGAPSPADLRRINALLEEALEIMWNSAGADARPIALTCVLAPIASG